MIDFSSVGAWFDQAGKDAGEWFDQAGKDVFGVIATVNDDGPDYSPNDGASPVGTEKEKIHWDDGLSQTEEEKYQMYRKLRDRVIKVTDTVEGTGDEVSYGQRVAVHYRLALEDGYEIDRSIYGNPLRISIGDGNLIGLEAGLQGMKVGGERTLEIPPRFGYGSRGVGGIIPPNATLFYSVELVAVEDIQNVSMSTDSASDEFSLPSNLDPMALAQGGDFAGHPRFFHLPNSESIATGLCVETYDPLTNPDTALKNSVSEIMEPDSFGISGREGAAIELDNELQIFLTEGSAEFSDEKLQAELVNSMTAPSEFLA